MIAYTEKGHGLFIAIAAAGHYLYQRDNVWIATDDAAVQAIMDAYPLAAYRAEVMAPIKQHAQNLIYSRYPQWRQANMTARAVELSLSQPLSPLDALELEDISAAWAWVRSVRLHCAALEEQLNACTEADQITAWRQSADWQAGWPIV